MSESSFTLVFPARPEYLLLARLALTGVARLGLADEETLSDLRLAVTEAAGNACRHAYDGDIGDVKLQLDLGPNDRLDVVVEDAGPGFDDSSVVDWRPEELGEDGMGLAIIRAVADEVEIGARADGSGTRVRFSRTLR